MFYNLQEVLTYNSMLNILIGERGVGKTYSLTKYVTKKFLKKHRKFIYLRRYKTELKESVPKFFDAIKQEECFNGVEFSTKGNTFYINKQICGYALSLSTSHILKSSTFVDVDTIIFDEFIIDKGCYHYLNNEVEQFLDFIETVGRLRNIKAFLLGNAISITNPYFLYFNLHLPYNKTIQTFQDGLILVNYIKNLEYRQVKHNSNFGKLIAGTNYSKYAIDNEFLRDNKAFVRKRTKDAKFYFTLYLNKTYLGVWIDYKIGYMFISTKFDINCPIKFALDIDSHNFDTIMIKCKNSNFFNSILEYYQFGKLCFENQKIKNQLIEILKKRIRY